MKIQLKGLERIALSDGSQLQKGYNLTMESELLQLLDASTIEGYKNKNVWLKLNPSSASSNTVIIRNILLSVESSMDLSIKGKGTMNLKSVKYIQSLSDAIVIA